MKRRVGFLLVGLCLLSVFPVSTQAQSPFFAEITPPILDNFPMIQAYLRVLDEEGGFLRDVQSGQIRVVEDGKVITNAHLTLLRPGAQIVIAINPGASFAVRDARAVSRFDLIHEALSTWAKSRRGSRLDDLSLLVTQSPGINHTSDSMRLVEALSALDLDLRNAQPSLDSLFQALQIATDAPPRRGMGTMVLWFTPPPEGEDIRTLDDLIAQARQRHIPVFVCMVASAGAFGTRGAEQLARLAKESGGTFYTFSGVETLPSIEELAEPFRNVYLVEYPSQIRQAGTHQIYIQIQKGSALLETAAQNFEINIQPPNPAFVNPPIQIVRQPPEIPISPAQQIPLEAYLPGEARLQIVVDFPDGRKRAIEYAALYVDHQLVDENRAPPFEEFTWDMHQITAPAAYILQAEVRDVYGMSGRSIETPVFVTFEQPVEDPLSLIRKNLSLISTLIAVAAGGILLLSLILSGKIHPRPLRAQRKRKRKSDPLTQPVVIENDLPMARPKSWLDQLQWSGPSAAPKAQAFLYRLSEREELTSSPPIPISSHVVIFGKDASKVHVVLDDGSISPVHARIQCDDQGMYRLVDEGSIAGTWLNYTPVSLGGAVLEHGDLVHFGRLGFRFMMRNPARVRKPVIISQKDILDKPPASEPNGNE